MARVLQRRPYEIPEDARAYRDRLRRTGQLLGYATLRPGLTTAATDRWAELGARCPLSARQPVPRIEVRLDAGDAAQSRRGCGAWTHSPRATAWSWLRPGR